MSIFTYEERTQKRWTIADAIKAANIRLEKNTIPIFLDSLILKSFKNDHKITLTEVNQIADKIVSDSLRSMGY